MDGLQIFCELASLKNQVKEIELQDNLGQQNFHEDMKEIFEPFADIVRIVSTKTTQFRPPKCVIKQIRTQTLIFGINER